MVKFKDFSRPLSVFQVLFNASLIFKDFSKQSCIFKYFSSLCVPCFENTKELYDPADEIFVILTYNTGELQRLR